MLLSITIRICQNILPRWNIKKAKIYTRNMRIQSVSEVSIETDESISSPYLITKATLMVDILNNLSPMVSVLLLVIPDAHLVRRLCVPAHRGQSHWLPEQVLLDSYSERNVGHIKIFWRVLPANSTLCFHCILHTVTEDLLGNILLLSV